MKSDKKETVEVTLVLNKREVEWLKDLMQNPLHGLSPNEEDQETNAEG